MDIFDKIMALPLLKVFQPQYKKYKEPLLYLLFGALTTLVSIITFALFTFVFTINELASNIYSWILSVAFAYITNRIWVFDAKTKNFAELFKQVVSFFSGRIITLGLEELIMLIFVVWLDFGSMMVKITAQVVVIVLNYFISKLWIFRKS